VNPTSFFLCWASSPSLEPWNLSSQYNLHSRKSLCKTPLGSVAVANIYRGESLELRLNFNSPKKLISAAARSQRIRLLSSWIRLKDKPRAKLITSLFRNPSLILNPYCFKLVWICLESFSWGEPLLPIFLSLWQIWCLSLDNLIWFAWVNLYLQEFISNLLR
jgi:hypothetical protein